MVRLANGEERLDTHEGLLDDVKKSIDALPRKIATWLTIFALGLTIVTFLMPSLRQAAGIRETGTEVPAAIAH